MVVVLAAVLLVGNGQARIDYSSAWDDISLSITQSYYARRTRHAEMERLLAKYKPIATAAHSPQEFEDAVDAMIAEFGDSHFDFSTDNDQAYYLWASMRRSGSYGSGTRQMPEIGAWFKKGRDGYTVSMVLNDSAAAKSGLRPGDLMLSVDGAPFTPVKAFASKVGRSVELGVQRGGESLKLHATVSNASALEMFLDATNKSPRVIEEGSRKIGYFHLWTQIDDAFKNSLSGAVYGKLSKTDAMILDLRDGFGGRPEGYGDPFFRPEVTITWDSISSKNIELFGYQRPLIVLINSGSRSAKEVLALIFKKSKRATLIGLRTAGNVLGTSPMAIQNWGYLEMPMVDVDVDGTRLEKNGVEPDIPVAREFDENGNDLVLARALEELKTVKHLER